MASSTDAQDHQRTVTQPTPIPLDPVSLLASALIGVAGQALGQQIAAYIVIVGMAGIGALIALGRREPDAKLPAWVFVLGLMGATSACAAGAAQVVSHYTGWSVYWLLAPVSLIAAAIGHEWPQIIRWALREGGSILAGALRAKTGAPKDQGGPQ